MLLPLFSSRLCRCLRPHAKGGHQYACTACCGSPRAHTARHRARALQAPAFGEDDYRVCLAAGVIEKGEGLPCPVDLNGRFTEAVTDFAGV